MGHHYINQTVLLTTTSLIATLSISAIASYFYRRRRNLKDKIPSEWQKVGNVTKLYLYPLKSGKTISLNKAECTDFGLKLPKDLYPIQLRDRQFMVYGESDSQYRSGRSNPNIILIKLSVHDENTVKFDAPKMESLFVKIPDKRNGKVTHIKCVRNESIYTIDCGDEAAAWFSRFIYNKDSSVRLGYHDASRRRDITKAHQKLTDYYKHYNNDATGLFSDFTSLMLCNELSVDDMNKRINNDTIPVETFRPNIVVSGSDMSPYEENNWVWIKIGDLVLKNVMDCIRCVSTLNMENGQRHPEREPLKILNLYRRGGESNGPLMGIHITVIKAGFINVGDPVYVPKIQNE